MTPRPKPKRKLTARTDGPGVMLTATFPRRPGDRYCERDSLYLTREEIAKLVQDFPVMGTNR